MTGCRSDRHTFETRYVVNSGVHRRWSKVLEWAQWSEASRRVHWVARRLERLGFPVAASGDIGVHA
jgi:hypothetical protein